MAGVQTSGTPAASPHLQQGQGAFSPRTTADLSNGVAGEGPADQAFGRGARITQQDEPASPQNRALPEEAANGVRAPLATHVVSCR